MSKFFKRIGTKSIKFVVHLFIEKIELNLAQPCRMAVQFKRGEHVVETQNAPVIAKGVAAFGEEVKLPLTMYQDKKTKVFQEKEAFIILNLITPKAVRTAGMTKVDLGKLLNKNKELTFVLPIEKCIDKKARFHVSFKFVPTGEEHSDYEPSVNSDLKSKKSANSKNKGVISPDLDDSDEADDYNSGDDVGRNFKNNRMARSRGRLDGSDSDDASDKGGRSRTADMKETRTLRPLDKTFENKNGTRTPVSESQTITTIVNNSSVRSLEMKLLEQSTKAENYQRENNELYTKIHQYTDDLYKAKKDYDDLKMQYEKLKREYELVQNDHRVKETIDKRSGHEIKNYREKVSDFEKELESLKNEKKKLRETIEELNKENEGLSMKVSSLQSKEKDKTKFESLEIERLQGIIDELNERIKRTDGNLRNTKDSLQREVDDLMSKLQDSEIKNRKLQTDILQKESRISELETSNSNLKTEVELSKKGNPGGTNSSVARYQKQIEEMEEKHKKVDEDYRLKINDLLDEITALKKNSFKPTQSISPNNKLMNEDELAKLSLENESLKRQIKDLNNKANGRISDTQFEDFRNQINELEAEKKRLEKELAQNRAKNTGGDTEKDNLKRALRESEDNNRERQDKIDELEVQLFKLKSKMGALMNAALEYGGSELLDALENIVTNS